MKKLIAVVALAAFAVCAHAQKYESQTVSSPSPISAVTNLASPVFIDTAKQQNVSFAMTLGSAGTQTNIYKLCPTVDGTNYDTNNVVSLVSTTTGAVRTTLTNVTAGGIKGYFLISSTPYASAATTNTLKYGVKTSAP